MTTPDKSKFNKPIPIPDPSYPLLGDLFWGSTTGDRAWLQELVELAHVRAVGRDGAPLHGPPLQRGQATRAGGLAPGISTKNTVGEKVRWWEDGGF